MSDSVILVVMVNSPMLKANTLYGDEYGVSTER